MKTTTRILTAFLVSLAVVAEAQGTLLSTLLPAKQALFLRQAARADAAADLRDVLIQWSQGVENVGPNVPWAWGIAATAAGVTTDGRAAPGGIAIATGNSGPAIWPPGFASFFALAGTGGNVLAPDARARGFASALARDGVGQSAAHDGDTLAGVIRFIIAHLTVDPQTYPPLYPLPSDPVLDSEAPGLAEVQIAGSIYLNDDLLMRVPLFHINVGLGIGQDGLLSLLLDDSTGTLTPADFSFFSGPNGQGFELISPTLVNVPFEFPAGTFSVGTRLTLDLTAQAIAQSTFVDEPHTLLLLLTGLVSYIAIRRARQTGMVRTA